jgi:SecDF, P1 head subdomain
MNEERELIGRALRGMAERASTPRISPDSIWRAGRRRRLRAITASAATASAVIAAAAVVPLSVASPPGPSAPGEPVAPFVAGSSVRFQEVAGISLHPCAARAHGVPGTSPAACYHLTGAMMTVTRLESVRIVPAVPGGYALDIRLMPADARKFAVLTGKLAGQPTPRCQLAIIIDGRVVASPTVDVPISDGRLQIAFQSRARAENLLGLLLRCPQSWPRAKQAALCASPGSTGVLTRRLGDPSVLVR